MSGLVLEPVAVVSSLEDVAMMREPVGQGGGELCATEDGRPLSEA